MSLSNSDTIAAIATPPGQAAIALLRVSGPQAVEIAERVFRGPQLQARVQTFGKIVDENGIAIDEVLLTSFPGPNSYTGEDTIEISCHGGLLVTQTVLERLLQSGARHAEGGEFTQRAFLNGKLDLTQAEAVMDVISAQTTLALRAANEQLGGKLGGQVEQLRQDLIGIVAHVEAYIDFPEEDIDPDVGQQLLDRIAVLRKEIERLTATADQGRILREGVRTVIAGAPNVGKSSLMNVLLGFDRAIVSDTAGTTRDTIEEVINVGGIPLRLVDTAGVRDTADSIEREGVSRAEQQIQNAELVLEVLDGSHAKSENADLPDLSEDARYVCVLNKLDLGQHADWSGADAVSISCVDQSGIDELTSQILSVLQGSGPAWGDHSVAVNARHKACLIQAGEFLSAAAERLEQAESPEFAALELRSALDRIGDVIGKTDVEEILGEIFGNFCIGK
ncbi:MAG: tRNA uridine-5-carboxymethylaminomethyl(34) synthesis GTPase MnmE [Verrucomicrobiota bacterium]